MLEFLKINTFNCFSSKTLTLRPIFLNLTASMAKSWGVKLFEGSLTKSLVKNTPSWTAFSLVQFLFIEVKFSDSHISKTLYNFSEKYKFPAIQPNHYVIFSLRKICPHV